MDDENPMDQSDRLLGTLKAGRGECPDIDLLLSLREGELPEEARLLLEKHVSLCGICQELLQRAEEAPSPVDDLAWKQIEKRLDRRAGPWSVTDRRRLISFGLRPLGAVAALLVVTLAGVVWITSRQGTEMPPPASLTRGSAIQVVAPAGRVDRLERFEWTALPAFTRFRVQIRQGNETVWQIFTPETRYQTSQELLRHLKPGVRYRWKVDGIDSQGQVVGESGWTEFQLVF